MNFEKDNFLVMKQAISSELANFIYNYFLMKRQVAKTLLETRYLMPYATEWGVWTKADVPNTYSHYSDVVMETLLLQLQNKMEEVTGLKLNPTYSYARIYKKGDVLERHKDRFSCEISTTLNLGGDAWPIFLEPEHNVGNPDDGFLEVTNNKGIAINLSPGDMLVYKGNICEHWREEFKGDDCAQVFLHYNNIKSENADKNKFDGRPHLGLPEYFSQNK